MGAHSIAYGDERIGFSVRHLPRPQQRLSIHVMPDGTVRIDAPDGTDANTIKEALRRRARWVWQQLAEHQERQRHVLPRGYVSGETHFYLGRRHPLKLLVDAQRQAGVRLWRGRLEVHTPRADLPAGAVCTLLEAWYRARASEVFARMLKDVASRLAPPQPALPSWRLLNMRTQWGSCSPAGELLLNPGLVRAPRACIEYVLAHELCHLQEHQHSPRFYRLLSGCLPDWQRRKQELDTRADLWLNR